MFFSWLSDKYKQRAVFIALQTGLTLLGLFLMGFVNSASLRYFGMPSLMVLTPGYLGEQLILLLSRHIYGQCRICWLYSWYTCICECYFIKTAGKTLSYRTSRFQSANNTISHSKRAVSTAMIVSFGGLGGIFATTVFRQIDFPRYLMGIYATITCQLVLLILLMGTTIFFRRENQKALSGCHVDETRVLYTL